MFCAGLHWSAPGSGYLIRCMNQRVDLDHDLIAARDHLTVWTAETSHFLVDRNCEGVAKIIATQRSSSWRLTAPRLRDAAFSTCKVWLAFRPRINAGLGSTSRLLDKQPGAQQTGNPCASLARGGIMAEKERWPKLVIFVSTSLTNVQRRASLRGRWVYYVLRPAAHSDTRLIAESHNDM